MRLFAILIMPLLLAACWAGTGLYSDSDARPALTPGTYRMEAGDEGQEVQVSILPSGLTQFEAKGEREKGIYGFAPLDEAGHAFVAWFTSGEARESEQAYTLVEKHPDGRITFYQPSCQGEEASVAKAAGAAIRSGMIPTCQFASRASLELAMRELHPLDYGASMKLIPIDK